MSEIKPEVLEMSKALKAGLPVGKDGSCVPEEGLYEKTVDEGVKKFLSDELTAALPDGAILEVLKGEQQHRTVFMAGGGHALGGNSIDVMKKNAEVGSVSVSIPTIGKDSIDMTFKREVPVPNAGGEGTKTSFGSLQIKVNTYSAGNRGQLAKVKQDLSERAQAAFGG